MTDRYLIGQKAICDYLGCSRSTLRRWVRERGLPAYRVRGGRRERLVVSLRELNRWLRSIRESGLEPAPAGGEPPGVQVLPPSQARNASSPMRKPETGAAP